MPAIESFLFGRLFIVNASLVAELDDLALLARNTTARGWATVVEAGEERGIY